MVKEGMDAPSSRKGLRERTFTYDPDNERDKAILKEFDWLIWGIQASCCNCKNYYRSGGVGGYMSCCCEIYGNLESLDNPHYGMDGSKCKDYERNLDYKRM